MIPDQGPRSRWTIAGHAGIVAALIIALVVLRRPLVAWFTGGSMSGGEQASSVDGRAMPGMPGMSAKPGMSGTPAQEPPGEIDHYTCSMHPSVHHKGPGTCPICGMKLVPVRKEHASQGVIAIDESHRQLIGVRTGPVVLAPMKRVLKAVGLVAYDESALVDVSLRVRGWITSLRVSETGQRVTRGETLFTLYSPELYNAQQDFLLARKSTGGLADAAHARLALLGMSEAEIATLAKSGAASESEAFASPSSGFVIEKDVVEGGSVDAGVRVFRIAALDRVWIEAEIYEQDLASVHVGQHAAVTLDYLPGRTYDAKVAYVYPYLDPKTRTGRARVVLANKGLDLRPGMYAALSISADLGMRLQVPVGAVVYAGPRRIAFVDLGQGRFRPREVQVGPESDGMVEVLSGLEPGDVVATSGAFLIAADARITTTAKLWDAASEASDAGSPDSEGGAR
ncbi:MAG: efflux RND transporter periplasmic adaptor subunit [Polyangiaceae bacterium]